MDRSAFADVGNARPRSCAHDSNTTVSFKAQIALVLLFHVVLWTWVGVSSRSNFDTPGDMVEAYVWSQGWPWGTYKHPPLSAWVAGLWFSVVPESQWGYSLLAALNGAVGMTGLAVLARQFMPGRWVLLCIATAALTPGMTSLALRFNANAILISSWPWALALWVLLMGSTRHRDMLLYGVMCGMVSALAMLGKYTSGALLLTMLATSLLLPDWRRRWLSAGPWLAIASFWACMTPHMLWVVQQTEGPLQYAAHAATGEHLYARAIRALTFGLAQWAHLALAFAVLWLALQGPHRNAGWWQAVTSSVRPRLNVLWLLGVAPIIATVLGTVLTGARTSSVWGMPIPASLMLLAVSRVREVGGDFNVRRLWRGLLVVWGLAAVLSPLYWTWRAHLQLPSVAEPREELAQALNAAWLKDSGHPLPWITGTRVLAASASFYTAGQARYWSLWNPAVETPWVSRDDVLNEGGFIVCALPDQACTTLALRWSGERRSVTVAKRERGVAFKPVTYAVFVLRPRASANRPP